MIPLTINNFFIYCSIAWGTNILLNSLYVIKKYIPQAERFDWPIDGGLQYKKDRLVGESTTLAGLCLCVALSILLSVVGFNFSWTVIPLLTYLGHMIGSIIKRRMHRKGGEFVPFVDHGDYMITIGFTFVALRYITPLFAIYGIALTYVLHPIVCLLSFKLKLKKYPY
jgi:hypothetical protein